MKEEMLVCGDKSSPKIIPLDRRTVQDCMDDLLEIEHAAHKLQGVTYSTETWTPNHFLYEGRSKFNNSFAVSIDGRVAAFVIGSEPFPEILHIHRIAVHSSFLRRGLSTLLLSTLLEKWSQDDCEKQITAMVNIDNQASCALFRSMGFEILSGTALEDFLIMKKQKHLLCGNNCFEDEYGNRYFIFSRSKEMPDSQEGLR